MTSSYSVQMNAKRELVKFLNTMKSVKNSTFTHTSITEPAGSFYILSEYAETFDRLYTEALRAGCDLYMTEKHRDIGPVLIDLDLRFQGRRTERQYAMDDVKRFVERYVLDLGRLVEFDTADVYVMEKSAPVWQEDKSITKDGLHIVVSNVSTRAATQLVARELALSHLGDLARAWGCSNDPNDIFDEAVITRNNWQMYGSKKPGAEPYVVTHRWKVGANGVSEACEFAAEDYTGLVSALSIRNKQHEAPLRDGTELRERVSLIDKQICQNELLRERKTRLYNKIIQSGESDFNPHSSEDNLDLARQLIAILSITRAESYSDWMRLGWCLRNISIDLLVEWDRMSASCEGKYVAGECDRLWFSMREGGLGMGTLHMWAKQDDPTEYARIMSENIYAYILRSISDTDYDIAVVICKMFQHRYRCASTRHHTWYEFKNHRWQEIEKGYTLFYRDIPTLLFAEYMKAIQRETQRSLTTNDQIESDRISKNVEVLAKIQRKFKSTNFVKDKMYKECSGMLYEPKFEEKLDSNPALLGFENGVYDLDEGEFREGRPEDYVSFSTGINYIEYDPENPYVEEVRNFISQVLVDDEVREYAMTLFASMLHGENRDENFHVWTGSGSNGKSKFVELFQLAIGEYACIFSVSMLTQKRVGSSQTNSELAIAKGKRFAILQEPEENERLNVGYMKELTGGDKVQCRSLFKEPIKFKPMFTMILTCNHMPTMPPDDGGTWRRVRRVEFTSKFVDVPSPKNPNEFKRDHDLSRKLDLWAETFMCILLSEYYPKYKHRGRIGTPAKVMEYTREYQRKNDVFADFCENYIYKEDGGFLQVAHLFQLFREYCNQDNIRTSRNIKRSDFQEAIEKRYGFAITARGRQGWNGLGASVPEEKETGLLVQEPDGGAASPPPPSAHSVFG